MRPGGTTGSRASNLVHNQALIKGLITAALVAVPQVALPPPHASAIAPPAVIERAAPAASTGHLLADAEMAEGATASSAFPSLPSFEAPKLPAVEMPKMPSFSFGGGGDSTTVEMDENGNPVKERFLKNELAKRTRAQRSYRTRLLYIFCRRAPARPSLPHVHTRVTHLHPRAPTMSHAL